MNLNELKKQMEAESKIDAILKFTDPFSTEVFNNYLDTFQDRVKPFVKATIKETESEPLLVLRAFTLASLGLVSNILNGIIALSMKLAGKEETLLLVENVIMPSLLACLDIIKDRINKRD